MKQLNRCILPKGFKASAVSCGIKKSGKLDLALFLSLVPAKASCLFTTNTIQAAPVILDKQYLKKNKSFRAIIANSGNANCFTSDAGLKDAVNTSLSVAKKLNLNKEEVLVASTGIIGKRLPVSKIASGLPSLVKGLSYAGINAAARAVMTTDTFPKLASIKLKIGGRVVSILGVAKGAGMISPNMATLLVFIFTDANITQGALNRALKEAVGNSFNCITVDGCMSTNDSVMLLANGLAGNELIKEGRSLRLFGEALSVVTLKLAKMVIQDAEGASKFINIRVSGAKNFKTARAVALNIANSNLFKTALYGENANFGRVVAAVGATNAGVKEKDLKVRLGSLKKKNINVEVSINQGDAEAVVYTSDLTPEYIKINAEYS